MGSLTTLSSSWILVSCKWVSVRTSAPYKGRSVFGEAVDSSCEVFFGLEECIH